MSDESRTVGDFVNRIKHDASMLAMSETVLGGARREVRDKILSNTSHGMTGRDALMLGMAQLLPLVCAVIVRDLEARILNDAKFKDMTLEDFLITTVNQ